jgi:hypothetical protein
MLQVFELQADRPVVAEGVIGKPPHGRVPDMRRNARVRGADVLPAEVERKRFFEHAVSLDVLSG